MSAPTRYFPEEPLFVRHQPGDEGTGHFPGSIGQLLANQYRIVRKLGWSTFCNVWLCEDTFSREPRYVSIKVQCVRDANFFLEGVSEEGEVLRRLSERRAVHPGSEYCLTCYEQFVIDSPVGTHSCFVTEVLGSSLRSLQMLQPDKRYSLLSVKRIIKQILLATDYLHRTCQFIHTDLKSDNILVAFSAPPAAITSYIQDNPSRTYQPLFYPELSPAPIVPVKSEPLPNFGLNPNLNDLIVKVIDYGEALPLKFYEDKQHFRDLVQADMVRAPEVIVGCHVYGPPIDIWSIGCLAFELLTGSHLFGQAGEHRAKIHLQRIQELLGPFPAKLIASVPNRLRPLYFDNKGMVHIVTDRWNTTIEAILSARNPSLSSGDVKRTGAFLRSCFVLDPTERPTALLLSKHRWIRNL